MLGDRAAMESWWGRTCVGHLKKQGFPKRHLGYSVITGTFDSGQSPSCKLSCARVSVHTYYRILGITSL